ncbi:MAG: amidohydrolase family protein [Spirochaetota bacterium]
MKTDVLIYNGRIIAQTHVLKPVYVLIKSGIIASIGEDWTGVEAERKIDAAGFFVSPGFIDMHTHGIKEVDFMEADVEGILRAFKEYTSFGVTRVVATTLSHTYGRIIEQIKRMRQAGEDKEFGYLLHGAHVEGPWLAPRCRGGHALQYLTIPEKEDVNRLLGEVGDVIRTVTFAPELPNAVWLTEQLSKRGIVPVLGHTAGSFEEAVRWGSINPAVTLGIEHETGSISIGKYADIVLLDDDMNVKMTFLKGRLVFQA